MDYVTFVGGEYCGCNNEAGEEDVTFIGGDFRGMDGKESQIVWPTEGS